MSLVRPLDRYVFTEWVKIFLATAIGFPVLLVVIDLTDHLQKYLDQNLPRADIALSYVYWMPQSLFMAMPAAVLFATVFSIVHLHAPFRDHGGEGVGGELLPHHRADHARRPDRRRAGSRRRRRSSRSPMRGGAICSRRRKVGSGTQRYNFVYAAEYGRVYKAQMLDATAGRMDKFQIERKGNGPDYPSVLISSQGATYTPKTKRWSVQAGGDARHPRHVARLHDQLRVDDRPASRPSSRST